MGESAYMDDPPETEFSIDRHALGFNKGLVAAGFQAIRDYDEVKEGMRIAVFLAQNDCLLPLHFFFRSIN